MDGIRLEVAADRVTFSVDERAYSRQALFKAAYAFIDRYYVFFTYAGDGSLIAVFKAKGERERALLPKLAGEFHNELLHQELRQAVARESSHLRELILGRALYSACLEAPEAAAAAADCPPGAAGSVDPELSYKEDRLGISRSWFEGKPDGGSERA